MEWRCDELFMRAAPSIFKCYYGRHELIWALHEFCELAGGACTDDCPFSRVATFQVHVPSGHKQVVGALTFLPGTQIMEI